VELERELPCEVSDITECLAEFAHPIERVGFEAGTMSQHLYFGLTAESFDVVCREAHGVRALLSTRKALLKKTMDIANEACGLLEVFGIRLPMTVKHGSFDGVVRPLIEMDDVLVHALVPLLDARVVLYQHFLELDRRVKRAARHDEVCMWMMTVPGAGRSHR
jgi:transposase